MFASKKGKRLLLQRLHAKRHPVDPGGVKPFKNGGFGRGRVGFGGDFDVGRKAEQAVRRFQNAGNQFR